MLLVEKTLAECNKNCMSCGDPLVYVGLKPTVCDKNVCRYGFEDLGAGFDLAGEIAEQPQVLDLLITSAVASVAANRMHFVTPDSVKVTVDGKELDFKTNGALDTGKLKATLDKCPSLAEMQDMIKKNTLKDSLYKIDPLLAPLLRWLIISNRARNSTCRVWTRQRACPLRRCAHLPLSCCCACACACACVCIDLRPLLINERIKGMMTDFQFCFLNFSPDKEARFQQLKKTVEVSKGKGKGSILAWHGSDMVRPLPMNGQRSVLHRCPFAES
jgi:hypothetical protein